MRVLLDACVLYPTVMREVLLGAAAAGFFTPLWSARILGEWAHAAAKAGPQVADSARVEIALLRDRWPGAEIDADPATEARLTLPDADDRHVLAAAISGRADTLCTVNLRDFPTRILTAEGVIRRDPDGLLLEFRQGDPAALEGAVRMVQARAEKLSGTAQPLRPLLKKAGLPRLGKALG